VPIEEVRSVEGLRALLTVKTASILMSLQVAAEMIWTLI
jgi:hypothetical protein